MNGRRILSCCIVLMVLFSNVLIGQNSIEEKIKLALPEINSLEIPRSISIPTFNGDEIIFKTIENDLLSAKLKNEYPDLRSFDLIEEQAPYRKGKLTVHGNDHMLLFKSKMGLVSVNNLKDQENSVQSGFKERHECGVVDEVEYKIEVDQTILKTADNLSNGATLRTYDLVIVATGEFTSFNGGTTSAMTAITNTVNGWNLILGNEIAVDLFLKDTEIYANASTDPFTPNTTGGHGLTNQAAEACAMNWANSFYDVGQVFHNINNNNGWAGAGVAGLGVVCSDLTSFTTNDGDAFTGPAKAAAWSGAFFNNSNDWIQLSIHELGHQFNAQHTFNGGLSTNCNGAISSSNAYEIGSGSTIMSYNGLCGAGQNVPNGGDSDNYFHSTSIDRMLNYVNGASGNCSSNSSTGNTPPVADADSSGASFNISGSTPFELTGSASDANGDILTYQWEQIDEDGAGTPTQTFVGSIAGASAIAPLFRSYPPSDSPTRIFPTLNNILDGNNTGQAFEALPTVSRTIDMAFIVRDNNPNGGGIASDGLTLTVDDTKGPFIVTSQNSSTTWTATGSSTASITWNVANTNLAPVSCANVDILLSTNNGQSFDHVLAANVPNDGSHTITIPNLPTLAGRIKIKCSDNIFFDINNSTFTINSSCIANGAMFLPDNDVLEDQGSQNLNLSLAPEYGSVLTSFSGTIDVTDPSSTLAGSNSGSCANFGNSTRIEAHDFQVTANGTYSFATSATFGIVTNVYQSPYNPASPCTNWLASSYNTNTGQIGSSVSAVLSAGVDHTLVISSFSASLPTLPAAYTTTPSGPGDIIEGIPPPAGFSYTFVITNNATGNIVALDPNSDLSSLSVGDYSVCGLSYDPSENLASYVGTSLTTFESDLLDLTICGNKSSNSILVTITGVSCPDADGDTVCDDDDVCPGENDLLDSDSDLTPDCLDGCPNDPNKILPGICGCGIADDDTDLDGTLDCNDGCPNDANKITPGDCGCGVADTDSDLDGTADCNDACPNDPNKISPGDCGCGNLDTDADSDGISDCIDPCLGDPLNMCNVIINEVDLCNQNVEIHNPTDASIDISGWYFCNFPTYDQVPILPAIAPGGYLTLTWTNLTADGEVGLYTTNANFADPANIVDYVQYNTPNKTRSTVAVIAGVWDDASVAPSITSCPSGFSLNNSNSGANSGSDTDSQTWCETSPTLNTVNSNCANCSDPCYAENGTSSACSTFLDQDNDGTCDANDGCPNDPNKIAPGICGCGVSDIDTDLDGTADCNDACPNDPNKIAPGDCGCGIADTDSDSDGTADCIDGCPNDPNKIAPGICGCDVADTDTDLDGTVDCNDGCPNDPNKIAPGTCGCGVADGDNNGNGVEDCLEDPTACEAYNFVFAPTGLFEDQTFAGGTKTRLNWTHYSDATTACIVRGGTIGALDVTEDFTQSPGKVLIQGVKVSGIGGLNYSAQLLPNASFQLFVPALFPSGPIGGMVPDAFYKWQVQCGCLIDPSLPLPDRLAASNVHLSPWSDFDLFTNLSLNPADENDQIDQFENMANSKIYPNPFTEELILELDNESMNSGIIEIRNTMGQMVKTREFALQKGMNYLTFNTQDFERGIFFINIVMQEKIISHKVVKY